MTADKNVDFVEKNGFPSECTKLSEEKILPSERNKQNE